MKDETDKNHHDQYFVVSRTQQKGPLLGCSVDGGNHDFDPPCGSHQLPVFLKFSVGLKLLAQLVNGNIAPKAKTTSLKL